MILVIIVLSCGICDAKIIITKQPKSQNSRLSGEVDFTVEATGKNIKYQWYVSRDQKKTWHKIKHQTSRTITVRCKKSNNGYYYRCRMKDASKQYKVSRAVRIYTTDINKQYQYKINKNNAFSLFYPKAADGYCYVYCHDRTYEQQVIDSINIINRNVGKTFIYTKTGAISDIVLFDFYDDQVEENMWFRNSETYHINTNGKDWAGVTFNEDGIHYLVGLNSEYFSYVSDVTIRSTIIHELGHCIGIDHSPNENDIMYYMVKHSDKMTKNDIKRFKCQRKLMRDMLSVNAIKKSGITDIIKKKYKLDYET